jgi:hypothetical protein
MIMSLQKLMAEKIATLMTRKSVTNAARWAEKYRVIKGQKWVWDNHPWLYEMHLSTAPLNVGKKASQMGFTEWALNTTFYHIDVNNFDVLYILPSESDASDFSASRFDPALEASEYLQGLFQDVKNVGHKRAGQANLYVRGSRSRSKLKSIPTAVIVFDELEEMEKDNVPLARQRASGQKERHELFISTPTFDGVGIDLLHKDTTQEEYFFKCPSCSRLINLDFPASIEITAEKTTDASLKNSYYKCNQCNAKLPHQTKSEWLKAKAFGGTGHFVPQFSDRDGRGFSVNRMYSSADMASPYNFAIEYLNSYLSPSAEQEFFNSALGKTHVVEGAQINDQNIIDSIGGYRKGPNSKASPIVTMGIDVGKFLHIEIDEWYIPHRSPGNDINEDALCRVLYEGTVKDFELLDQFMMDYRVNAAVIDRHPETRKAYEFAMRFWGRVLLCMYGAGMNGKQVQLGTDEEKTITVDRTAWLDLSLGRFKSKRIKLPADVSEEYKRHIKEPKRLFKLNSDGHQIGYYQNTNADHFAHARNYSEIALRLAASVGQSHTISGVL